MSSRQIEVAAAISAIRPENVSADVARLLGSLAADDSLAWQIGLGAYEQVHPLSQAERMLVTNVVGVFLWHPYISEMWKPYWSGYGVRCRPTGGIDWGDDRLGLADYTVYKTKSPVKYSC